jgi:hypothetical protein
MNRLMNAGIILSVAASFLCWGAAFARSTVMGDWEGGWYGDSGEEGKLMVQVVDEGEGGFRAVVKAEVPFGTFVTGLMKGKATGDAVELKGTIDVGEAFGGAYECWGKIVGEKFTGRFAGSEDQGRFELKKAVKKSPTLGAERPEGAIVLFDGKDLSKWETKDGKPNPWKLVDGAMEAGGGDIWTKQEFGDFKLHLEFMVPVMEGARGQGRGNSGVFLPGNCEEVQILDSYGWETSKGSCGAIYDQKPPDVNASLPPGEWQTYDITCLVPRFDENGNMTQKTILTVYQNGVLIHERFPAKRQTGRRHGDDNRHILLQDHGNPVRFRNIWLEPLKSK